MSRAHPLAREALLSAAAAATLAALLAWLGPPGSDLAAHAYQRNLYVQEGFELWNNFWYAGRYSFVTYSVIYYPLAALLGIKLLAVATIATAALAFAIVLGREWGPTARWSSRTFAVVWAGVVLSAAFPFALGTAFALLALWALQARARARFGLLAVLTLAASPLSFLLLVLVVVGVGIARRTQRRDWLGPALTLGGAGLLEVALWRAFPGEGRYPFPPLQAAAAIGFCLLGLIVTWRVERARLLRIVFAVYLAACTAAFVVPSALGENVSRLRFAAIPLVVLALSLRDWRPRPLAVAAMVLVVAWNAAPIARNFVRGGADPASAATYWVPAIDFLRTNLTPAYRVEVVDTAGHWAAVYLPRAGIPLARGWFRQDDFPQNRVLYGRELGARSYLGWLRRLGIRYVVLPEAPHDYSARAEAELLRSGQIGLKRVLSTAQLTIFEVPSPRPIVTGPGPVHVRELSRSRLVVRLARRGTYRIALRHSPYWRSSAGCLSRGVDGMLRVTVLRPATVRLAFNVDAGRALWAVAGRVPSC
jgi:hypothetical protein